jgi:hypothetical protein
MGLERFRFVGGRDSRGIDAAVETALGRRGGATGGIAGNRERSRFFVRNSLILRSKP